MVDVNGHTPLFRACERGHTEVIVVLLHASASVELKDTSGRSCLHWAASGGHSAICSSLLHHGLPADTQDSGGWVNYWFVYSDDCFNTVLCCVFRRTALHCAAYGGFSECVRVLLEEGGASVTLQDDEGITALHWACSVGHMDVIHLLLTAGANPNVMEVDGGRLTPLDYAIIGGHQEAAQLLIESGGLSISSIQELAANMIQKCVRGFLVRKKYRGLLKKSLTKGKMIQQQMVATREDSKISEETSESEKQPTPVVTDDSGVERRRYVVCVCAND